VLADASNLAGFALASRPLVLADAAACASFTPAPLLMVFTDTATTTLSTVTFLLLMPQMLLPPQDLHCDTAVSDAGARTSPCKAFWLHESAAHLQIFQLC